jgi:hypothetical protein
MILKNNNSRWYVVYKKYWYNILYGLRLSSLTYQTCDLDQEFHWI